MTNLGIGNAAEGRTAMAGTDLRADVASTLKGLA